MKRLKEMDWWYWFITDGLLIASLVGWRWGIAPAIGLTLVQLVHYFGRERRLMAFPVQVRTGYLLLLVLGMYPPLVFIHWIQLVGTTAMVAVGYCPLARFLVLMPWNRNQPLSFALVWRTIVSPPVAGSIQTAISE